MSTPCPSPRPSALHKIAVPVFASLGIHGLLLLGLRLVPCSGSGMEACLPVNTCVLAGEDEFACSLCLPEKPQGTFQFPISVQETPAASYPTKPEHGAGATAPGLGGREVPSTGTGGGHWSGPAMFQVQGSGQSVVYVLDRSLSMGLNGALAAAKRELLASLQQLPETVRFQVVLYNRRAESLRPRSRPALLLASEEHKQEASALLESLRAEGSTDHQTALREALALQPEVMFWITDAAALTPAQIHAVTQQNHGRTAIHAIELSRAPAGSGTEGPLALLARSNRGTYRRVCLDGGQ